MPVRIKGDKMIKLYKPQYNDLWFRQKLLADPETMAYNYAWGGTIAFPEEKWRDWYDRWIDKSDEKRFYCYLVREADREFVGETAYHYDETKEIYLADVIVFAKHRGNGFGKMGLQILCEAAKNNGVKVLYDDIAIDNPAVKMFLGQGFVEEYRTDEIIMLKKEL